MTVTVEADWLGMPSKQARHSSPGGDGALTSEIALPYLDEAVLVAARARATERMDVEVRIVDDYVGNTLMG